MTQITYGRKTRTYGWQPDLPDRRDLRFKPHDASLPDAPIRAEKKLESRK